MLCPEVVNFRAPDSRFKVEKGASSYDTCLKNIYRLHYNHLVSVVLPDTVQLPKSLPGLLITDCQYYQVPNITLSALVDKDFINSFIKKGSLCALSINTRIDCDDCTCITSNGLIYLSLTKESYQTLGLEGRVSHFHQNTKSRYIVCVDLLKEYFKPGKKNYERVKERLSKLKFTLLLNWHPHVNSICPSSIAKYFYDLNYEVKVCLPEYKMQTQYSVKTPSPSSENISEFVEWLGVVSVQGNLDANQDDYLTTYTTPEPCMEYGQVKVLQWRGFFTPKQIEKVFNEILKYCADTPWLSLYVQGFSDAPLGWGDTEHHYFTNGDNAYVVILKGEEYFLCRQSCSQKCYK